jgi:hypothetical protein
MPSKTGFDSVILHETNTRIGTSQDGKYVSGGTFNDTSLTITTSGGPTANQATCGFVFDLNWNKDAGGILLDPPIIDRMNVILSSNQLATNFPVLMTVSIVPELTPADYSDSSLPGERGELFVGWGHFLDPFWTTANPLGQFPLSTKVGDLARPETLDFPSSHDVPAVISTIATLTNQSRDWYENTDIVQEYTRNSTWTGRVALQVNVVVTSGTYVFDTAEGDVSTTTAPLLQTNYIHNWTGIAGVGVRNDRSRVIRDDRFGMPIYADEITQDELNPGFWVKPSDWDEDQDDPRFRYHGNNQENKVDDIPRD